VQIGDSPEEAAFRAEARAWLEANAPKKGAPGDFSGDTRRDAEYVAANKAWQRQLYDGGWAGLTWPVEYGGRGLGPAYALIFHDEQAHFGVSTAVFDVGIGMAGPTIIRHGNAEQRDRYLAPLLRGEEVWCQLFSEPGAGSDLAGLRTRAEPDGDDWIVNGQKVWTSYARFSDFGILLARTDPHRPRHRGITFFLLDMRTPGIDIRPIKLMNGAAEFNEVFLTDVRVPSSAVLGEVHGGWRVAMTTLSAERGLVGSDWYSSEELIEEARRQGVTGDPLLRQRLAEVVTGERILRYLGYRVQTAMARGDDVGSLPSAVNLLFARHLKRTGDIALALLGPEGMRVGSESHLGGRWQGHFVTAPSVRIASGTDEIQRNIIGERGLGLPREPRPGA
jgi:alkylation response protein AidB-like acyl-CoA dehydrogenase